jgi:hypothetical protein
MGLMGLAAFVQEEDEKWRNLCPLNLFFREM